MKDLRFRLSDHGTDAASYHFRYSALVKALGSTVWPHDSSPTSSAIFLAAGTSAEIHDRLWMAARLTERDLLCVLDHDGRTYCCSGDPQIGVLDFIAAFSGYAKLESQAIRHAKVANALMRPVGLGQHLGAAISNNSKALGMVPSVAHLGNRLTGIPALPTPPRAPRG
jgi:hypothetical protein